MMPGLSRLVDPGDTGYGDTATGAMPHKRGTGVGVVAIVGPRLSGPMSTDIGPRLSGPMSTELLSTRVRVDDVPVFASFADEVLDNVEGEESRGSRGARTLGLEPNAAVRSQGFGPTGR